jgi:hypothetical protein
MAALILAAGSTAWACGPEGSAAKLAGGGKGGFTGVVRGGGFAGGFDPRLAYAAPSLQANGALAQVAQHHQLLAAQAAAYRARRAPLKLAKAMALREANLAKRAEKRAWVLAKQEEWKRKKALEAAPAESDNPDAGQLLLASAAAESVR